MAKKKTKEAPEGVELKRTYKQIWKTIRNKTRIRQVYYDVYGTDFLVEPKHSVKIVTELKEVFIPVTQRSE